MTSRVVGAVVAVVAILHLWGCSDDTSAVSDADVSAVDVASDTDGSDLSVDWRNDTDVEDDPIAELIEALEVNWVACSLYEGEDDGLAQCATVQMPLFWDRPDGRTMTVTAKRLLAEGESEAQLWFLDGGPGGAGTFDFPATMAFFQESLPTIDMYTIDHRGTGYSERLGCPQEGLDTDRGESITTAEMPSCVAYLEDTHGDRLDAFTSSYSAYDLHAFISHTREEGERVMLRGGSYGTYFAHRYLQIFPEGVDGVVLEGIVPPDGSFVYYDEISNQVAEEYMSFCAQDEVCRSKLGDDPWAFYGDVLDRVAEGHCTRIGLDRDLVRALFAFVMYSRSLGPFFPAAVYRLDRCEPEDESAIAGLFNTLFGSGGAWDIESYSILLQHHVGLSEMWEHPDYEDRDLEAYFAELYEEAYVLKNSGPARLALLEFWPLYHEEVWDDGWADTDTPMLMLQGGFDPATPAVMAASLEGRFDGPRQYYVLFDQAHHGVTGRTPLEDGSDCSLALTLAFLTDPTAELDTSCVEEVLPIDFAGSQAAAQAVFGTDDLWENGSEKAARRIEDGELERFETGSSHFPSHVERPPAMLPY